MGDIMESIVRNNVSVGDVKCRTSLMDSEPGGEIVNELNTARNNKESTTVDIEQEQLLERKKKTRRRKAKRKNPYSKQISENRGKKNIRFRGDKSMYEQPVAPYNSNQFLIEDHNDLQDFDVKIMAAAVKTADQNGEMPQRTAGGRIRDSSFTSAESDEDFFYSSPEDEEEFLTKEFSNAYQDLHVESLTSMSKAELIQQVLQLEERVDMLQRRLGDKTDVKEDDDKSRSDTTTTDKSIYYQTEISRLVLANEELKYENARLREQNNTCLSESSEDSESDSSSSSDSSDVTSDEDAMNQESYKHMNGEVHAEDDVNMDPTDNT